MDTDRYSDMLAAVSALHEKHDFRGRGGEELTYRITLMTEELGEIAACVSKGRPQAELAEECADLLILLLGTALAQGLDLSGAFWGKMRALEHRESRTINGRVRLFRKEAP